MTRAYEQFNRNLESLVVLDMIYQYLSSQATAFDISEILRAEFVLTVSAMDCYIHEVVREGLLNSLNTSNTSVKLKKVSIPLDVVSVLLETEDGTERDRLLNASVRDTLSKDSYQSPRNIESALGLVGFRNVWAKICDGTDKSAEDVKRQLDTIVLRRNKIAHEADINFHTQEKEVISSEITTMCREFVKWIIDQIELLIEARDESPEAG